MAQAFLTVEQAATQLGLHVKTVLRAIREGRLRATKVGKSYRILSGDLDTFAGVPQRNKAPAAKATVIVDVADVSPELASRLMNTVPATLNARGQAAAPVRAEVVYDPAERTAKLIIVATPADAGALLGLVHILLEG